MAIKDPVRRYQWRREYYLKNKAKIKNQDYATKRGRVLKYKYGISLEQYEEILKSQGGVCAICGGFMDLHIDHDHLSGRVRGILCRSCNHGIGHFYDNPTLLFKAIGYLRKVRDGN